MATSSQLPSCNLGCYTPFTFAYGNSTEQSVICSQMLLNGWVITSLIIRNNTSSTSHYHNQSNNIQTKCLHLPPDSSRCSTIGKIVMHSYYQHGDVTRKFFVFSYSRFVALFYNTLILQVNCCNKISLTDVNHNNHTNAV
jgi:hypothetical protein